MVQFQNFAIFRWVTVKSMMFEDLYAADDFSTVRCPFWLKFQEMNGLGHGYVPCEIREDTMMCVEPMGKKLPKIDPKMAKKSVF